ncbi:MAG: hypothetical protein WBB25_05255 [Sulfitobacter sp.]
MSDTALSEEAMLASLRGLSLPPEAAGGMLSDIAVVVGLAACLALLAVALVRLLSVRRVPAENSLKARMMALTSSASLTEDQRRVALLHLLKSAAPERFAEMRGELYRPGGHVDLTALQAEVARHV